MKDKIKQMFAEATDGKVELSDSFFEGMTNLVESQAVLLAETKKNSLNESFNQKVDNVRVESGKRLDERMNTLTDKLNGFMKHTLNEWALKNEPVLNSNIKVDVATDLFVGMKNLMESHNINIDHNTEQLVESKTEEAADLKTKLNESETQLIDVKTELETMKKTRIVESVMGKHGDLVESQKERLITLSGDVDYKDDDSFTGKFETLVESVISAKPEDVKTEKQTLNEDVVIGKQEDSVDDKLNEGEITDPYMKAMMS